MGLTEHSFLERMEGMGLTSVKCTTNADKLRSSTDEELAEFIAGIYPNCPPGIAPALIGCNNICAECWLEWLKQKA